jgi:chromosome segregation ATPase
MRVVALLLASLSAAKKKESPVDKVVELLADLKAKIEADGRTEQALYDKYACWSEETTARKATAIEDGKAQIESLSQTILELNAAQGSSTATIAKLEKDIAETKDSIAKAEALRKKEAGEYDQQVEELTQAIGQLEKAVKVLSEGTTWESKEKERWNSAEEETKLLTVAAGVRSALRLYTKDDREMAAGQDLSPMKSFLSNPAAWVETKAKVKAPHNEEYTPQSGVIQGILDQMLADFKQNLADAHTEEGSKNTDYDSLMKSKRADLELLTKSLTSKSTSSADDGSSLEDSKVQREEAEAALKADEEFFDNLKQGCKDQANLWASRSRVRTQELGAISEANDILTSETASGTFEKSATTFLQIKESARSPRKAVYNALKKAATKTRSVRLAELASRVYTTEAGHFDVVMQAIDEMITMLHKEQEDDFHHRDWCENENGASDHKIENLEADMDQLSNKIERLTNKKNSLIDSINKTDMSIDEIEQSIANALSDRNESHVAFMTALKDDSDAVELIGSAIEVLASVYPKGLIQMKSARRSGEEPNPDNEPEKFAGDYGGKQSEGGGIVSMLEMLKEDIENEMAKASEEEAAAQKEYETLKADSVESINALNKKKATLQQDEAATDMDIANTEKVHFDTESERNATVSYVEELKGSCDWVLNTFDTRKEQRDSEISGLQDAKSILGGAGYDEAAAFNPSESTATSATLVAKTATNSKAALEPAPAEKSGGWQDPKKLDATIDQELAELDADSQNFGKAFLQRHAAIERDIARSS